MLSKLPISRASRVRVRRAGPDRSRGAAVLCSLLIAALWLTGCESQVRVVRPGVTITAAADVREAGTPLVFTVRVSPAPAQDVTFDVEIDAVGCVLPEQPQLPQNFTISAGDEEYRFTVRTEGIEMGGEEGCTVAVTLTEGGTDTATTAKVTVIRR